MNNNNFKGFTLIELMIVIAIVGILAALAAPQYNNYQKRSRFSEVILATTMFKTPAEIAVQTGRITTEASLNEGTHGIPPAIDSTNAIGTYVSSVTISGGVIIATGSTSVDDATYELTADITLGGIRWSETDSLSTSCQQKGLC